MDDIFVMRLEHVRPTVVGDGPADFAELEVRVAAVVEQFRAGYARGGTIIKRNRAGKVAGLVRLVTAAEQIRRRS